LTKNLKFLGIAWSNTFSIERGEKHMVRRSIFDKIFREMQNIRYRLDDLENTFSNWKPQPLEVSGFELLSLPDHLRKTYMIVASKGESDATDVANKTGRCRAIESNYLNQLARMGWLSKRRVSKTIHFRLISKKVVEKAEMFRMGKSKTN
jgi:hypothetical protein